MILVFGRTGQVASELQLQGNITAIGRDQADLSDPAQCAAAIREFAPRAVINAAAYTAVDKAEEEEPLARLVNGDAPTAMAAAASELGIPFLHVSTDYVFDGSGDKPWKPEDKTAPLGAYGRTKLAGETGIRNAGGQHAILRTSWVFSAHGNNFVKTMLRFGRERDELNIVADQIGGPTAARDIASALLQMAERMTKSPQLGGTHHFSGDPAISWADFAREIFRQADISCTVNDIQSSAYPTPAMRPANSRMDCSSLLKAFDIGQPDWKSSLSEVLNEVNKQ